MILLIQIKELFRYCEKMDKIEHSYYKGKLELSNLYELRSISRQLPTVEE